MTHIKYLCYRFREIFKKPVEMFEINASEIGYCKIYIESGLKVRIDRDFDGSIIYIYSGRLVAYSHEDCDIQSGFFLRIASKESTPGSFSAEETINKISLGSDTSTTKVYEVGIEFVSFRINEKDIPDKIKQVDTTIKGG